jgi:hypothetical protein
VKGSIYSEEIQMVKPLPKAQKQYLFDNEVVGIWLIND